MPLAEWRCVNHRGLVPAEINFISRGPVCHAEPIFKEITIKGVTYTNVSIGAHADGGVKIRPIDFYPVDFRFSSPVPQAQYDDGVSFLEEQIGKGYNFPGIGDIMIDHAVTRDWHDNKVWFCSELVTAWHESMQLIKPIDVAINLVTPTDVLMYSSAMFG